jgi:hypothetical protein
MALSRLQLLRDRFAATGGNLRRLEWYGWKAYSQSDEDGIVAEIFRRIGTAGRVFVEIGAETGWENNSRYLLEQGWSGLWVEGKPEHVREIDRAGRKWIESGALRVVETYVTRHNVDDLIRAAGIAGEIDFLSIDIDSLDYYVFEAIASVDPRVVCLEHNYGPHARPPHDWVMPYDESYRWDPKTGPDNFGASIVALTRLARTKGYELVGTGLYSGNGFYVRRDLVSGKFSPPFEPERFYRPLDYHKIVGFPKSR